uniref:Response regulator transcription factor n=1 Tax=Dictyoglomus thermophilum TaxID=14 RepID=A0A7C3RK19_DICTH
MKKILIVEDEENVRSLIRETLDFLKKYEIHEAGTGREALEKIREVQPDLVILDIMLPDIDGYSICEQIKGDPSMNTMVLMLTARSSELDKKVGYSMGADEYMTKPFGLADLISKVELLLGA